MEPVNKPLPTVKVDIHSGSASPAQVAAWRRFWRKIIADARNDEAKVDVCGVAEDDGSKKSEHKEKI